MKTWMLARLRQVTRLLLPLSLRRMLWNRIVGKHYDRAAIKATVAYIKQSDRERSERVRRLIQILEANSFRVNLNLIKQELGLDFKGYSSQDLIAFLFFNGKTSGFYIDIGAFDGVEISNTFALERLGWEGVCIEPIPEVFNRLQQNRKCHVYNAAITSTIGETANFIKVPMRLGLSGLDQQMPARIRQGLEEQGLEVEQITVKTMTFDEVMAQHREINHIQFLSVDVEGSELDVLESIDFNRLQVVSRPRARPDVYSSLIHNCRF